MVAVAQQVLGCQSGSSAVIAADDVDSGQVTGLEIEQHDRGAAGDLGGDHCVIVAGGDDDQAIDTPGDQRAQDRLATVGGTVGVPASTT